MNSFSKTITAIVKKFLPVLFGLVLAVALVPVSLVNAATFLEHYNTGDDVFTPLYPAMMWCAQSFTANSNHSVTSVKLLLYRVGAPGTVTVSIRETDANGHPTDEDLALGTTDGNTLTTNLSGEWREITFTTGYNLIGGTKYAIVWSATENTDEDNCFSSREDASNPTYPGGCHQISMDSGINWTSHETDAMFEVWGELPVGEVWVDDDYDADTPGWGVDHFATITTAIDAASAGDTIIVHAGTYTENVEVNKQLTLTGDLSQPSNVVVDADDDGSVITLTADGCVLQGFQVQNGEYGIYLDHSNGNTLTSNIANSNSESGIYLDNSDNNTLTSNTANSNTEYGIYLDNSNNNTLTSNIANENTKYGIYLNGNEGSQGNTLTGNTANQNSEWGIYLDRSNNNTLTQNTANSNTEEYGIYLDNSSSNTLTSNTANSNTTHGIYLNNNSSSNTLTSNTANSNTEYGIYLDNNSSSNTLTSNTANSNTKHGIYLISNSSNNTLTSNTVNSNTEHGIYLDNSSSNTLTQNTISGNGQYGIHLNNGSNNNTFTSNHIPGNNIGIKIQQSVDASTISIHFNYIYSNTNYGVDNTGGTSDVDAENNWWGASNGPSPSPGVGDKVSGNVDYDPWLVITVSANPINIAADGSSTSTITADMTINSDGEDTSTSGHIIDGTQITFTTDNGSIGSTTVTKTTVSGVTTATLTSSTESGITTVKATAGSDSSGIGVFFLGEGDTAAEALKTDVTSSGNQTVDALTEADTEVDKTGTGTPAITVALYSSNPGEEAELPTTEKYIDAYIDDPTIVDETIIKVYYTEAEIEGLKELLLRVYWWDGSTWVLCSNIGIDITDIPGPPAYAGYVWVQIRDDTIPSLTDLKGAVFTTGLTAVGGVGAPAGTNSLYGFIKRGSILNQTFVAESFDGKCRLTLEKGTEAQTEYYTLAYVGMYEMPTSLPLPEEAKVVGVVYSFKPEGAMFDPPATLEYTYDPADIPEGIPEQNLTIAYWDAGANNWVKLDSTVDIKAKTVTANKVRHFTAFAVLAFKYAPAAFTVAELNISPDEVNIGETVNISVLVSNTGGTTDSYTFTLSIDGVVEATKDVTVNAGTSQEVSFTISKNIAGSYSVDVNRLTGSFVVKEKTSSESITEPVAPSPTPPSSTPPAKTINWPIIWGIIAALVVVGSTVVFLTKKGY